MRDAPHQERGRVAWEECVMVEELPTFQLGDISTLRDEHNDHVFVHIDFFFSNG
jgi:hypothetical protein